MHFRSALPLALFGASLAAQTPVPTKQPVTPVAQPDVKTIAPPVVKTGSPRAHAAGTPVALQGPKDAIEPRLAAALEEAIRRGGVQFDQPTVDAPIWATGASYKASFAAGGWSYEPYLGGDLPSMPVRFALRSVRVAGNELALGAAPVRTGNAVEFRHAAVTERIELRDDSVEQTFVFEQLDAAGGISVTLDVQTDLPVTDRGDGVTFETPLGPIGYSEAVAIDALGRRVHAETEYADGRVTIVVPAEFATHASLPLTIDPIVRGPRTWTVASYRLQHADLAWDEPTQHYAVSYERVWSATDHDCFVQLLDADMNLVGGNVIVDNSADYWAAPRIANNRLAGRFLVVAQVSAGGTAPSWVEGRLLSGGGTLVTPQFDIAKAGVSGHVTGDKLNPDVGGDPLLVGPTYFCVVWERAFSSTDHDIHMKLVQSDGTLLSASPTFVDNSTGTYDARPAVSKSNGGFDGDDQTWGITWQREYGPADWDVYGAFANWTGQLRTFNGSTSIGLDTSFDNHLRPQFSEPNQIDGLNQMLLVYLDPNGTGGLGDIIGQALRINGTTLGIANLSTLENDPSRFGWNQVWPSVATDGTRFAVAYHENFNNTADLDARVSLFGWVPGTGLVAHESAHTVSVTSLDEFDVAIASRYSGSGVPERGFCIAHNVDSSTSWAIRASGYDGYADGGFFTRTTGCGSLSIAATGETMLGAAFTIHVNAPTLGTGVLAGLPVAIAVPTCAGCVLGVQGEAVMTTALDVTVPRDPALVGATVGFQGFRLIGGSCFGQVSLSDTIDVKVR